MTNTIAVANQAGGAGKTTTALGLAGAYTNQGKDTLLIDLDPFLNQSQWADEEAIVQTTLGTSEEWVLANVTGDPPSDSPAPRQLQVVSRQEFRTEDFDKAR